MPNNEIDESDCCGNGCTNCILDNKPKPSQRALLAGKHNVILNYAKFRLLKNTAYNGDDQVRCLHLSYVANEDDNLEDDGILDIPPGHHIMLRVVLPEIDHQLLLRPYSPYWTDFIAKEFKILVKLQTDGPMSRYLSAIQPLQLLEFRGPIGNYIHNAESIKSIYIIAQGVAIAPTMPLVTQVLDNEDDISRICHLICAQDLQHVYFRDRLLEFAKYWNYRSCLYLAHQQCSDCDGDCVEQCDQLRKNLRYKELAHIGRLDATQLATHASHSNEGNAIVIIAGHSTFQRSMRDMAMSSLRVSDENIFLL